MADARCSSMTPILEKSEVWNAVCGQWDYRFITIVDVTWMYLYCDVLLSSSLTSMHWCFCCWLVGFRLRDASFPVNRRNWEFPTSVLSPIFLLMVWDLLAVIIKTYYYIYMANLIVSENVLNVSISNFYTYSGNAFCVLKSRFYTFFNIFVKYL